MRTAEGKVILSINDVPEIRAVFDGFAMKRMRVTYTISEAPPTEVGELIVANFNHPLLNENAVL
ncbi:MAG: hypothetical protein JJ902_03555 [Roseibium sp.]|nr:hypothetical protein [Roseibium sp.]